MSAEELAQDELNLNEEYDPAKPNSYDAIVRKRRRKQEEERLRRHG